MGVIEKERTVAEAGTEPYARGIWRGTFVIYNLGLLGAGLAVGGALPLAALVLTQGTLVGIAIVPVLAWAVGALVIGALHAVHDQDLTSDIEPLRRLVRGVREALRQSVALWVPFGLLASLLLGGAALHGRTGPDLTGLLMLLAAAVLVLTGSVIAARFTAGGAALWRYALGAVGFSVRGVLGIALVAAVCVLLIAVVGEWALLFASAPLAVLLDRSSAPLLTVLENSGAAR